MNQTNLSQKLAPLGVAVFGAISCTGIAVVPAQAAVFTQEDPSLQWTGDVSDFVEDARDAIANEGSFTVTFNPSGESSVRGSSRDFDRYFPDLPDDFATNSPTVEFNFVTDDLITPQGFDDAAEFKIENDLTFSFLTLDAPGTPVTLTLRQGSIFTALLDPDGGIEVALDTERSNLRGWEAVLPNAPDGDPDRIGIAISSTFSFDQSDGSIIGVYSTTGNFVFRDPIDPEPVPEPASILGLLTIVGLGLGLKRKKQS